MPRKLIVLDFDGTMTDAEVEGEPFRVGYLEDVRTVFTPETPFEDFEQQARHFEIEVAGNPDNQGWNYGGRIVAPSVVDPYLRIMPVVRKLVGKYAPQAIEASALDRLLDAVFYKYNYQKTVTAFRDGAGELLQALLVDPDHFVVIVTNSETKAVQNKVRALVAAGFDVEDLIDKVYGHAKKYKLDDEFDEVPETMQLPGLERPVFLRRRLYSDKIEQLLAEASLGRLVQDEGLGWEDVIVLGDIFELDLCLPLAMGATVGLLVNENTPGYEKDYLEGHERGHVITELSQFPELLEQLAA